MVDPAERRCSVAIELDQRANWTPSKHNHPLEIRISHCITFPLSLPDRQVPPLHSSSHKPATTAVFPLAPNSKNDIHTKQRELLQIDAVIYNKRKLYFSSDTRTLAA